MTTEVLRQRAEIEESIRGRTVCDQLRETAEQFPDDPALSQATPGGPDPGGWATLSWAQARQQALELAAGFIALGLAPGERVAIMMPNRTEHVLADFGAVHAGGVPVTFYATLAAEQVGFVAGGLRGPDRRAGRRGPAGPVAAGAGQPARPEHDHRPRRERVPGGGAVPDLGRFRRAGPRAAGRGPGAGDRAGGRHRARRTRSPCCTPPGPPATPRASCSPTTACSTRWPPRSWAAPSPRTSGGSPTCRWPTSRSACSASTCRSARPGTCTSARTRSS